MNMKNIIFSALMFSAIFPYSFVSAHNTGNPSVEATKLFFGIAAGAIVIGTGTVAGAVGGGIAGGVTGLANGGPVVAVLGGLGGAVAGGTAGLLTGAAVVSALFDEKEKRDDKKDAPSKKEELKEALHKKH